MESGGIRSFRAINFEQTKLRSRQSISTNVTEGLFKFSHKADSTVSRETPRGLPRYFPGEGKGYSSRFNPSMSL